MNKILIAGGGVGGLAAALACSRAGATVALFERAGEFSEVGAGIQLGPNVTKVLYAWGLQDALARVIALPQRLQVCSATTGAELGVLRLGEVMLARYGSPYATIHRADLHALLLAALKGSSVQLNLHCEVGGFVQDRDGVTLQLANGHQVSADVLVGADGISSRVRQQLLQDGAPGATGHLAYRALVPQSSLPEGLRSQQITVWLGPRLHIVQYPVRGGDWLNVVVIVEGCTADTDADADEWNQRASAVALRRQLITACAPLQDLIQAIDQWRLWRLCVRPPMRSAHEHAQGRVALLGDAAHPMLPYLAQGAGMAIEDAFELARALLSSADPAALSQYAAKRWQRNARVQVRALRNGRIFHASGPLRWARDAAMKLLGESLLDMPWLYTGV